MLRLKVLIAAGISLLVAGCAGQHARMDARAQPDYVRQDLGLTELKHTYRCTYKGAAFGESAKGMRSAFCFTSGKSAYVRLIDATNERYGKYIKIDSADIASYSIYRTFLGMDELQVRAKGILHGLVMRPDGLGYDNDGTNAFASELGQWGIEQVASSGSVPMEVKDSGSTYIYVPTKKK